MKNGKPRVVKRRKLCNGTSVAVAITKNAKENYKSGRWNGTAKKYSTIVCKPKSN